MKNGTILILKKMGAGGDGDKTESDQLSLEPVFFKRNIFPAFVKPKIN